MKLELGERLLHTLVSGGCAHDDIDDFETFRGRRERRADYVAIVERENRQKPSKHEVKKLVNSACYNLPMTENCK